METLVQIKIQIKPSKSEILEATRKKHILHQRLFHYHKERHHLLH